MKSILLISFLFIYSGIMNAQVLEYLTTSNSPLKNFKGNTLAVLNQDVFVSDSSKYIYRFNSSVWHTDSLPDSPNGPNIVRKLMVGRDSILYAICDTAIFKKSSGTWLLKGNFPELPASVPLIDKNGDVWLLPNVWQTNTNIRHISDTSDKQINVKGSSQQSGQCNEALINDSLVIWLLVNDRTFRIINDTLITCFNNNPIQRHLALDDSSRVFAYAIHPAEDIKRIDQNGNFTGIWFASSLPAMYRGSGFCRGNNYYSLGRDHFQAATNLPNIIRVDPNIPNLVNSYDFIPHLPSHHQNIIYDGLIVDEYDGVWFVGVENQRNNIYCYRPANTLKNRVAGRVFFDANANGIKDPTEVFIPSVTVKNLYGNQETKTDSSGYFEFNMLFPGANTLELGLGYYWQVTTPSGLTLTQNVVGQQDTSIMIGIWAPSFSDANISGSSGMMRSGINNLYILSVQNFSLNKQYNVLTTVEIPPLFNYVSALPQPDSVSTHKIWLNIDSLDVFEIANIFVYAYCPTSVGLGTPVSLLAYISCPGDTFPANDTVYVNRFITGSYDPNNKLAYPDYRVEILPGDAIEYTINFQNTGNDTAFTVLLRDTLDMQLDIGSFVFKGSSHICSYNINQARELTFLFENILLPDSSVNFIESMGFVCYSIKPHSLASSGSIIYNTAHIYFDFNSAITTNTTSNTIYTSVNEVDNSLKILCYPNPFANALSIKSETILPWWNVEVFDINGRKLYRYHSATATDRFDIMLPDDMGSGIYLLKVSTEKYSKTLKLVKM